MFLKKEGTREKERREGRTEEGGTLRGFEISVDRMLAAPTRSAQLCKQQTNVAKMMTVIYADKHWNIYTYTVDYITNI